MCWRQRNVNCGAWSPTKPVLPILHQIPNLCPPTLDLDPLHLLATQDVPVVDGSGGGADDPSPSKSEQPVWTTSEADNRFARHFPGKPQATSVRAFLISISPNVCDSPGVDSRCDSFGVDFPRLSSAVSLATGVFSPCVLVPVEVSVVCVSSCDRDHWRDEGAEYEFSCKGAVFRKIDGWSLLSQRNTVRKSGASLVVGKEEASAGTCGDVSRIFCALGPGFPFRTERGGEGSRFCEIGDLGAEDAIKGDMLLRALSLCINWSTMTLYLTARLISSAHSCTCSYSNGNGQLSGDKLETKAGHLSMLCGDHDRSQV